MAEQRKPMVKKPQVSSGKAPVIQKPAPKVETPTPKKPEAVVSKLPDDIVKYITSKLQGKRGTTIAEISEMALQLLKTDRFKNLKSAGIRTTLLKSNIDSMISSKTSRPRENRAMYLIGSTRRYKTKDGEIVDKPVYNAAGFTLLANNIAVPCVITGWGEQKVERCTFPLGEMFEAPFIKISEEDGVMYFDIPDECSFKTSNRTLSELIQNIIEKKAKFRTLKSLVDGEVTGSGVPVVVKCTIAEVGKYISELGNRSIYVVDETIPLNTPLKISFNASDVRYGNGSKIYAILHTFEMTDQTTKEATLRANGWGMLGQVDENGDELVMPLVVEETTEETPISDYGEGEETTSLEDTEKGREVPETIEELPEE